ncbi:hypothetical protein LPJ57_010091 [Coemansia sp. RSA 486]|nr:hypothetical protein LPJ57_010091 [Coemansia sp. RSA 486]
MYHFILFVLAYTHARAINSFFERDFGFDIDFGFTAPYTVYETYVACAPVFFVVLGVLAARDVIFTFIRIIRCILSLACAGAEFIRRYMGSRTEADTATPAIVAAASIDALTEEAGAPYDALAEEADALIDVFAEADANALIDTLASTVFEAQNEQISDYAKILVEEIGIGAENFVSHINVAIEALTEDIYAAVNAHTEFTSGTSEILAEKTIIAVNLFDIEVYDATQILYDLVTSATTAMAQLTVAQDMEVFTAANALRRLACAAVTNLSVISNVVFVGAVEKVVADAIYFAGEGSADAEFQADEVISVAGEMAQVTDSATWVLARNIIYSADALIDQFNSAAEAYPMGSF